METNLPSIDALVAKAKRYRLDFPATAYPPGRMGRYYLIVLGRAGALYWKRIHAWRSGVIRFLLQTALLAALLYFAPVLGDVQEHARQALAVVVAVTASSALMFGADLLRAPFEIDNEKNELINEQSKALAAAEERGKPRLQVIGLVRKSDQKWYIEVKNQSPTEGLSDCLARIEELTSANGEEIMSYEPLATENQVGDRPRGRFNLDPDQTKRVVLAEPVAGSHHFVVRILGAQRTKKLERGDYKLRLRFSTSTGGSPIDLHLAIQGDKIVPVTRA
jgi:hypothetical protein